MKVAYSKNCSTSYACRMLNLKEDIEMVKREIEQKEEELLNENHLLVLADLNDNKEAAQLHIFNIADINVRIRHLNELKEAFEECLQ